jgi:hypothetical protein
MGTHSLANLEVKIEFGLKVKNKNLIEPKHLQVLMICMKTAKAFQNPLGKKLEITSCLAIQK